MQSTSKIISIEALKSKQHTNQKEAAISKNKMSAAPAMIWKSRISWRIALSVFMTILAVQTGILNITLKEFETGKLHQLRELSHSAITPLMDPKAGDLASPISDIGLARLLNTTKVKGLTIYSDQDIMGMNQLALLKSAGEPTAITLRNSENLSETYRSADGSSYEVILRLNGTHSYFLVTRMDSSSIQQQVFEHVKQTILIMLLLSGFVTTVLMIALGRWLLEPMLFMRDNLVAASKNPENPDITPSPFDPSDEVGNAIELVRNLITQNAQNIKHIKGKAEDRIHKLAFYDTLTELPNRTLFVQTLAKQAENTETGEAKRFAVVSLDLDHFKDINDTMGHNVGDAILRGVGKRLRSALPESATVARTGEDEFAITMPLSTNINKAMDIGEQVINVIRSKPFKVYSESFQIRASVGVSTFPDDATDPDQVLKNSDIALNRAKEEGRDKIKEYNEDFNLAVQERFQLLRDLRDAMEQKQLAVYFQPQLNLKTGAIIGAEALLRWWKKDNSKEGGRFISPADFIPVAEQSGLIVPIGEWVLKTSCAAAAAWNKEHGLDVRIAVNVAAAQFTQSDLCACVEKILNETGLDPKKLELEVTESVFMDDMEHTIRTLNNLHSLGVELAIDDFGTGYSSLSYLRQFPIDRLKIDQSFIRNALNNPDDAAIAKTIVNLGHSLNLSVIAEGVETKDHETFLIEQGCDEVQGFRYEKAIPNEDYIKFVKNYNGNLDSFNK